MLKNKELTLGQSIVPVCEALMGTTVFIGIPKESSELLQQGKKSAIQVGTAPDKFGRSWVYAWTTEERFNNAIRDMALDISHFMEMNFVDAFDMVYRDSQLAGIILDSNSVEKFMYPMPRAMFGEMKKLLQVH